MREVKFAKIYDEAFDLANITVEDDFEYSDTVTVDDGFFIDFDVDGKPVAIDMVEASKNFSIQRSRFSAAKIEGTIHITSDTIKIVMKMPEEARFLEKEILNHKRISWGKYRFSFTGNALSD